MLRSSFPLIEDLEEFAVFLSNAISHILGEPATRYCCCTTWHDILWHDMIRNDMIWYDMTYQCIHDDKDMSCHDMLWYDISRQWHDMIWYDMIWHNMIWHEAWYDFISHHVFRDITYFSSLPWRLWRGQHNSEVALFVTESIISVSDLFGYSSDLFSFV